MNISIGSNFNQEVVSTLITACQYGQVFPGTSATVMQGNGILQGNTVSTDASSLNDIDNLGRYFQQTSSAVAGTAFGTVCSDSAFRMDEPAIMIHNLKVSTVATTRLFIGVINSVNFAHITGADTLDALGVGFQFSSARGDTAWQVVSCSVASTTQTVASTGVTAAGNTFYSFQIELLTATSVRARIFNSTGTQLSENMITATLPASTTPLQPMAGGEPLAAASMTMSHYSWGAIGLGYKRAV